ncbi:AKT-interacting protein isoform X2 [Dermacentor andersoni]|uniref:AKT-interacting protein isoform X2 n=1 Tax=Dermacentor andersoni TaxID=34620 RepID=UPI0024175994|nr:AKT-interacting protein-like isoform X2 [Dermacentor andersoni]
MSIRTSRKMLPATPERVGGRCLQPLERDNQGGHAYSRVFLEYSLMSEYLMLMKQQLSGVYVMPSASSAFVWFGVLFIRQGLYQGGVFRFTLRIPENYPDGDCPDLVFESPIFHPLIDPITGELDIKRSFLKWRKNVNFLWQVLLCARRAFYKIETQTPLNPEAATLYEQNLEQFKLKVAESLASCEQRLYESPATDDSHALHFLPWDSTVEERVAQRHILDKMSTFTADIACKGSRGAYFEFCQCYHARK